MAVPAMTFRHAYSIVKILITQETPDNQNNPDPRFELADSYFRNSFTYFDLVVLPV